MVAAFHIPVVSRELRNMGHRDGNIGTTIGIYSSITCLPPVAGVEPKPLVVVSTFLFFSIVM